MDKSNDKQSNKHQIFADRAKAPLLSIIIANYNYGRFLGEAIESVINQGLGEQVELIICDAASTDNSVDIIRKYEKYITWWCSERDGGQSAAFNKGFRRASGRYLTWLNADDVLLPGALKKFAAAVAQHPDCEWFVGGVFWLNQDMRIIKCGRGRPFSNIRYSCGLVSAWGPSSFFTRRLLDYIVGVDERFKYMMDSDLWLRFAAHASARYVPFADYIWGLRLHPQAKMSAHDFEESGEANPDHPKWAQIKQEQAWMDAYFHRKKYTLLRRLLSASWKQVLAARIDTWRYKGKHYLEVFDCVK